MSADELSLINDTDRTVLQEMDGRGSTTAVALAADTDIDRDYLNTRLRQLDMLGYVSRTRRGVYRLATSGEEVVADA